MKKIIESSFQWLALGVCPAHSNTWQRSLFSVMFHFHSSISEYHPLLPLDYLARFPVHYRLL